MNITRREALKSIVAISAAAAIPAVVSAAAKVTARRPVALLTCDDHTIEIVKNLVAEIEDSRGYPIDPSREFIEAGCPACIDPRGFRDKLFVTFPGIFFTFWYFQNGKCPNMPDLDPHHISVRIGRFVKGCIMPSHKGGWKTHDLGPNSWIEENINA